MITTPIDSRTVLAPRIPTTLEALPPLGDFRGDFAAARAIADPVERLKQLSLLASRQLGFLETIQLDRALKDVGGTETPGFDHVRVALLSSATADHLLPAIRVGGLRRRLLVHTYLGAFGQCRQELLDPGSPLVGFRPQAILLSLGAREVLAQVPLTGSADEVEGAVSRFVDFLRGLWKHARETHRATVIQQTFLNLAEPVFGSYDRMAPGAPTRVISRLNDALADAAAADGVLLLDLAGASARDGLDAWHDTTRWLQAKQEIAPTAAAAYGDLVARVLAAQKGRSKKCLVLDLDNTLWGGVIGDDGLEGIVLGEGSARGEAHLALQRYAKQLRERGVILAVCSKNDPAIAEAAFREHPEMALRREDIACFMANWDDKAVNLQRIATELNIGIDSLVFVDDNPVERARIRGSLPLVAVPELPADAGQYVRTLAGAGYFEAVAFTADDKERAEQYTANLARKSLQQSAQSMDDFLASLDMTVTYGPVRPVDLARVTQLINKTNQFNTTTRRHTAETVQQFAADPDSVILWFRLVDNCGDNGLVSAIVLVPRAGDRELLEVDTWVMSCRVFGRQLEHEAMNIAVEAARAKGARALLAEYLPTPKNAVVADLYPMLGFRADGVASDGKGTRWLLPLHEYPGHPTHIRRRAE